MIRSNTKASGAAEDPNLGLSRRVSLLRRGASGTVLTRVKVEQALSSQSARLDPPTLGTDGRPVRPTLRLRWDERTREILGWTVEWPESRAA